MNWRNKLLGILAFAALLSCNNETTTEDGLPINFQISGTIQGAANERLYLEASTQDGIVDIAQVEVESDGSFEINGNIPGLGIYELRLGEGNDKVLPLTMQPGDTVKVKAKSESFAFSPEFSGPVWAKPLTLYFKKFEAFSKSQMAFQTANPTASQEEGMAQFMLERAKVDDFAKSEIKKDLDNPVNIILTSSLSPNMGFEGWDTTNLDIMEEVANAFVKSYPNSPFAARMQDQVAQIEMAYQQYLMQKEMQKNGIPAPEIALPNPEGKTVRLSDLKGKYVLIDFWASWCGPCRKENPNVVRLYKQYKNKDFTILSVSLDDNKAKWEAAILQDGLVWPYHVSDLQGWNTPLTQTYGFNAIPHTVLVDPQGKIVARNLRGASLEQKLKELL